MLTKPHYHSLVIIAVLIAILPILSGAPAQANSPAILPDLLQFTAGPHVLGFLPDKVYLVGIPHMLSVDFEGAAAVRPVVEGAYTKDFGNPSSPGKQAPPLTKVTYPDLWKGISLTYEATAAGIAKSTYILEPYADVDQIRLQYNLAVGLMADGSLQFTPLWGTEEATSYFSESAPIAWQEIAGQRVPVEVSFCLLENRQPILGKTKGSPIINPKSQVGFRLGHYNPAYSLVIDPTYQWHTFMGGSTSEWGYGIAVDGSGNVYVTGHSDGSWNGPGGQAPLNAYTGGYDIMVLKLNSSGVYQWHTFMGGSAFEWDYGIAVDGSGNVYVTGHSNGSWNGPGGQAPLNAYTGGYDIMVLKLNSSGAYQWHTFMGGGANNEGHDITMDGSGNVYIMGISYGSWNGPGGQVPLNAFTGYIDIVVLKLNSSGAYQWHTFMGSSGDSEGYGIATDGFGNVYVAGNSSGSWNGPGGQPPLNVYTGDFDIVVLKLDSNGAYQWHTFWGSGGYDGGRDIAIDGFGNVYVAGHSDGSWNGPGGQAPLSVYTGLDDIVVLKLNSGGAYQWHTFMGGVGGDQGHSIAVDELGNVHVTGYSVGSWNGPEGQPPLNTYTGGPDIIVLQLAPSPEIDVLDDTTSIPDGTGSVNFGSTVVSVPLTKTFTISNTGTDDLILTPPITLPVGFSLVSGFGSIIVTPTVTTTFEVQCDAAATGTYSGTLSFANNDADENPYDFTIACTVNAPEIDVFDGGTSIPDGTGRVNFGSTTIGTSINKIFTISNSGTYTLTLIPPITLPVGFSLVSSFGSTTIVPGSSTTFEVQCDATAAGMATGALSFGNNDADENPYDFTLTCTVNTVPQPAPPPTGGKDDDDDDDHPPTPVPPPPVDQVFDCWPWLVIVPSLGVPNASSICQPSLGTALPGGSTSRFLGHSTDIVVKDAAGVPVTHFNPPLKVCFRYTQSELDAVGGDASQFLIQTYRNGAWESLATAPESDPSAAVLGRACAMVDHLTLFALFAKDGSEISTAVGAATGSNLSADSPLASVSVLPETGTRSLSSNWLWLVVGVIGLTGVIGVWVWRRK